MTKNFWNKWINTTPTAPLIASRMHWIYKQVPIFISVLFLQWNFETKKADRKSKNINEQKKTEATSRNANEKKIERKDWKKTIKGFKRLR